MRLELLRHQYLQPEAWSTHHLQVRRTRLDRLLDQAQRAGCDVTLAKMVLATRSVSTSQILDIFDDWSRQDKLLQNHLSNRPVDREIITIIILNERLLQGNHDWDENDNASSLLLREGWWNQSWFPDLTNSVSFSSKSKKTLIVNLMIFFQRQEYKIDGICFARAKQFSGLKIDGRGINDN